MANNAIHEMISSFAAGCMDKKNYRQFREYMDAGRDLPPGELGELQNVISLLPVILELETPSPKLKDRVAKKLIAMQNEIKDKIKLTRPSPKTISSVTPTAEDDIEFSEQPEIEQTAERVGSETSAPADTKIGKTEFYNSVKKGNEPPPPTREYELPPRTLKDVDTGRGKNNTSLWIAFTISVIILLIAIGFVYYNTAGFDEQYQALETRVSKLEEDLNSTNRFIEDYNSLIEILNYNDIQIVPLQSAGSEINASGKFLLSFEHKEGLLEVSGLPSLGPNQAFQIWFINSGQSYSAGLFVPTRDKKYISIPNLPYLPRDEIDMVRITIEPMTGSEIPQGPVVLFGALNGTNRK